MAQIALPREETLYTFGAQWGPPTSFNPFSWETAAGTTMLYLPLFLYNGYELSIVPAIAKSIEWLAHDKLKVVLHPEAKWSDGTPITTEDVVFAWELGLELGMSGGCEIYMDIEPIDEHSFVVHLKKPNYYIFLTCILNMRPAPRHAWENIYEEKGEDFVSWPNMDLDKMVISGPYKVKSVSDQAIVFERIDNWWGKDVFGLPRPRYIVVLIFKDVSSAEAAFRAGEIDLFNEALLDIESLKKEYNIGTWFEDSPYMPWWCIWSLYLNNKKPPMNDPAFRRAIAYAIPYDEVIEKALRRTSYRTPHMYALMAPMWREYLNEEIAKEIWGPQMMPIYNPEKAREILEEAGYLWRDGKLYTPDGQPVKLVAEIPAGWEDSIISLKLIVESLRNNLGIEVVFTTPDESIWWEHLIKGEFDITESDTLVPVFYPPWLTYRAVMDLRLTAPIGEEAEYNLERYENPEVAEILDEMAMEVFNIEKLKEYYGKLQEIFARDLPIIPIDYGQAWYAYSTRYWTGWPNEKNPYWYPVVTWDMGAMLPVFFGIAKRGEAAQLPV
ncbi:MAG: ABC transporter substrate-binding protein [Ignisphaera sp.]